MAREKGMGNLQREKSGRWTMRVGIDGKRYCRSTRTTDRDKAERFLQRFLAPFGLGEHRLPLADVWLEYVKSPNRNELARATLEGKRNIWLQFAKWMEHSYLPVDDLAGVTSNMISEYLACIRVEVSATTYNSRVCVLREIFHTLAAKAGLEEDPWQGVRLRPDDSHSRRELTMDELRRLLDAAKKYDLEHGEKLERKSLTRHANCAQPEMPSPRVNTRGGICGQSAVLASQNGRACRPATAVPVAMDTTATDSNLPPEARQREGSDGKLNRSQFACGEATCVQNTKQERDSVDRSSTSTSNFDFHSSTSNFNYPSHPSSPIPHPSPHEWHTLFLIGIYTGLCLGDCCRLDWSNINIAQGIIQLIPRKTRRHAHGRPVTIPIHPALGRALLESKLNVEKVGGESRWTVESANCAASPLTGASVGGDVLGAPQPPCNAVSLCNGCGPLGDRPLPSGQHNIECGSVDRSSTSTPNFDFHSSTSTPNFDFHSSTSTLNFNYHPNSVDHSPTPTLNSNFFTGPVLPTISSLYAHGSWRIAHALSQIFKTANITTSVKLEGRRHRTPEATFHSLRHTFVSFAANAGVPLHVVQSIVGHESTAMTRHYYHENIAALQSAVAAIPTL